MTTLIIVLSALIVLNILLAWRFMSKTRQNNRKLQERIEEYDEATELHAVELSGAQKRAEEAIKRYTSLRKDYDALVRHAKWFEDSYKKLKQEKGIDDREEARIVSVSVQDFNDLKKTYNELAERYANPSKTYLVKHLAKAYRLKSGTALAKVLGVSQQTINNMLRKK